MYIVAQISPLEWKKASVCNHNENDDEINDTEFHHSDDDHHSLNSIDGHEDFLTNHEASAIIGKDEDDDDNDDCHDGEKDEMSVNLKAMKQGMAKEGGGNCCENYRTSTLQRNQQRQYFKNMCVMSAQNDLESIWMSLEYRQNFLDNAKRQSKSKQQKKSSGKDEQLESGSTRLRSDGNLDIDDDGLIGYVDEAKVAANNNGFDGDDAEEEGDDCMHDDVDDDGFACYHENALQADYEADDARDSSFETLEELQNIELISYVNNFSLKNSFSWTLGTLMQSTSDLYPKVSNCTDTRLSMSLFLLLYCSRAALLLCI